MRPFLLTAVLSALGFGVYLAAGEASPAPLPKDRTAIVMQAKLKAIHAMAEGLVRKDFSGIEQAGETLAHLCAGSDWQHHGDSIYGDYRDQLRRSALKVTDLARAQNLEGATYAYTGLMSSCVDCHAHCRDVLKIAETAPKLQPTP